MNRNIFSLLLLITLSSLILVYAQPLKADDHFEFFFPDENDRIKKFPEYVKREGDTLYFKLRSGSDITLSDFTDCESRQYECKSFQFLNYYINEGLYLIFEKLYEGSDYILVSDRTGERYNVYDFPFFSPDRKRLATISADETSYGKNGVFIWSLEAGGLVQELSYEPEEYALYKFVRWEDNKTVALSKFTNSVKELCPESNFMTVPVTLRQDKEDWRFYENLKHGAVTCEK